MLNKILKAVNNPYATIAKDGVIGGDIHSYIDTGIYMLNTLISGDMLHGGFPTGKVTALAGDKGTGKTYILMNAFKTYLDNNPKGEIVLFESEGAVSKELLESRGIDTTRISIIPVSTVEEFRSQVVNVLDCIKENTPEGEYADVVLGLDSLGMLSTEFEMNDAKSNDNKSDMGRRAKLIKSTFRVITLKLSILQIPFIVTNHTYNSMSAYVGKSMGGGTGLEYAASIIVFLSKSKIKDEKSKIKNLSGNEITCKLEKGRLTMEGSKISIALDFSKGINPYAGILVPLIESGMFKKKGAWISYNDINIAQGDSKFYDNVYEILNSNIIEEVCEYVDKSFLYGKEIIEHDNEEV